MENKCGNSGRFLWDAEDTLKSRSTCRNKRINKSNDKLQLPPGSNGPFKCLKCFENVLDAVKIAIMAARRTTTLQLFDICTTVCTQKDVGFGLKFKNKGIICKKYKINVSILKRGVSLAGITSTVKFKYDLKSGCQFQMRVVDETSIRSTIYRQYFVRFFPAYYFAIDSALPWSHWNIR